MAGQVLYGFTNLKDIANQRVTQTQTAILNDAIDRSIAEHNRQLEALRRLFVKPLTEYQLNYKSPGTRRLQPLDEQGRARPTKSGVKYTVGFPLQAGGDAFGQTFRARAKMTVEEVNDELASMLIGDLRWMRDHILSALFTNVTWTFVDEQYGSVVVQPLANADATTYQLITGADNVATDTHFLAQAAAIADATNPFPAMYAELSEHAENDGPYIALIPSGVKTATQALATFVEAGRPEIQLGANSSRLVSDLNVPVPGSVLGFEDSGMWIVEWPVLPANYIIGVAAGGSPPLGMREEPEAELQGFKRVAERADHPYYESQYQRLAGFGAWNRVGAVVQRVSSGSYTIPAGYAAPIA